jgi:NADH-quinone oxidoreductase E subunit
MSSVSNNVQQSAVFAFTEDNLETAKQIIAKYPDGRQASALLPLLDLAQRQHDGWLPQAAMDYLAEFLQMPAVRVYEVATFYTMFNLKPIGRHHVQVCTNLPCWLRDSDGVMAACKRTLGVNVGDTTEDGLFTLTEVECLGACVNAPMMQIGDDYYEDLSPETAEIVLNKLRSGEKPKAGSQIGRQSSEPSKGLTSLVSMPWAGAMGKTKEPGET